jgi:hypothetical protein
MLVFWMQLSYLFLSAIQLRSLSIGKGYCFASEWLRGCWYLVQDLHDSIFSSSLFVHMYDT